MIHMFQNLRADRVGCCEVYDLPVLNRLQQIANFKSCCGYPPPGMLHTLPAHIEAQELDERESRAEFACKLAVAAANLNQLVTSLIRLDFQHPANDSASVGCTWIVVI